MPSKRCRDLEKLWKPEVIRGYSEVPIQLREIGVNWVTAKLPHPNRAAYLEAVQWFARDVRGEMGEPINK